MVPSQQSKCYTGFGSRDKWKNALEEAGLVVREAGEDMSKVHMACVFNPPQGILQECSNLKAIHSLGAGVDFLMEDPTIPKDVPLLRIVDPLMAERMATFCLWAVTNIQRKCDEYYRAQMESKWDKSIENYKNIDNHEVSIGVMGLGTMGGKVASTLSMLGYPVSGWTRTARDQGSMGPGFKNVQLFHGNDQLSTFASESSILINLLPLTPETRGILNKDLFEAMPQGSSVMNLARGSHLVAQDLLDALETDSISSAVLDVFVKEPLPETCPFWKHPKVRVFPHMSSVTDIPNGVQQIIRNRELILKGEPLPKGVQADIERKY